MNDLDLDAIEVRYRNRILIISDGDNQPVIDRIVSLHKDLAILIAEVRRLRADLLDLKQDNRTWKNEVIRLNNHAAITGPNLDALEVYKNGVIAAMLDEEIEKLGEE